MIKKLMIMMLMKWLTLMRLDKRQLNLLLEDLVQFSKVPLTTSLNLDNQKINSRTEEIIKRI